jgi:GTP-binding protein Era
MGIISSLRMSLGAWINRIFKKRRAKIGLYGPPNAGKTTLANRIVKDWSGGGSFGTVSAVPHETRRAVRKEGILINANGSSIELDIVDTPGMATR